MFVFANVLLGMQLKHEIYVVVFINAKQPPPHNQL